MRASQVMQAVMVGGLMVTSGALAQEPMPPQAKQIVEGTVGNDVVQLWYMQRGVGAANSELDLGFLLAEDRQFLASASWMFGTDIGIPGLTLKFGPKGYAAWLEGVRKTQVAAIAGGLNARYEVLPQYGVAVIGHAFYSPGILTFGVAENVYDFMAGAEVQVTSRLTVLAGYRWLRFSLDQQPDDKLQNEVFAGARWRLN